MGGVRSCCMATYNKVRYLLRDEYTETEEESKEMSYMSSCLGTEYNTIKDY